MTALCLEIEAIAVVPVTEKTRGGVCATINQ